MKINLVGKKFGKLTVIRVADESKWKNHEASYWECKCDCGNVIIRDSKNLKYSKNQSCGCYKSSVNIKHILQINQTKRKCNEFINCGDEIKISLRDGSFAIIDVEDFDLVKNYYWDKNSDGYVFTQIKTLGCKKGRRKCVRLHKLLMPNIPKGTEIDHIDRNKLNNKRNNLRVVTHLENMHNVGILSSNKTGVRCVHYCKSKQRYIALFTYNKKKYYVGQFIIIEEAERKLKQKIKEVKGE